MRRFDPCESSAFDYDCQGHPIEQEKTWFEKLQEANKESWQRITKSLFESLCEQTDKENNSMKVSYKEVTGELLKLERINAIYHSGVTYKLEILDTEKNARVCFENVNISEVEFIGAKVVFGD